jgi:hypothetical protein
MSRDPWTDPDPQPGDFDADVLALEERDIIRDDGDPNATVALAITLGGEDAERLVRLAEERGKSVTEVIADLLRDADSC